MDNIKSYVQGVALLTPGVNLIQGENGAGKSTIVEAVGHAVFDALPYTKRDFIRRGAKNGTVEVAFVSSQDNREYHARRDIGSGSWSLHDPETFQELSNGRDATRQLLRELLNVEPETDLGALFDDIIGVPQGTMTAIFSETEAPRALKFNKLLRLDSYDTSYKKLAVTASYFHEVSEANERHKIKVSTLLEPETELRQETAYLEEVIKKDQVQIDQYGVEVQRLGVEIDEWNALQQEISALSQQRNALTSQTDVFKAALDSVQKSLDEAIAASVIVDQTKTAFDNHERAESDLKNFQQQRSTRDQLRAAQVEADKRAKITDLRIEQIVIDLRKVEIAEKDIAFLEPLVERQTKLESEIFELKQRQHESIRLSSEIEKLDETVVQLEKTIADLEHALNDRHILDTEIAQLQSERWIVIDNLSAFNEQHGSESGRLTQIRNDLRAAQEQAGRHARTVETRDQQRSTLKNKTRQIDQVVAGLAERESLTKERETLQASLHHAQQHAAETKATIKNLRVEREQLSDRHLLLATDGAECPVCMQPVDTHAREQLEEHYRSEAKRLDELHLQAEETKKNSTVTAIAAEARIRDIDAELAELPTNRSLEELEKEVKTLSTTLYLLDAQVTELNDAPEKAAELVSQELTLSDSLKNLEKARLDLQNQAQTLIRATEDAQVKLSKYPHQSELDRQRNALTEARSTLADTQIARLALQGVSEVLASVQQALVQLNDPRTGIGIAEKIASDRTQLEQQLTNLTKELDNIHLDTDRIEEELRAFVELDAQILIASELRDATHDDYLQHVRGQPIAVQLTNRIAARDASSKRLIESTSLLTEVNSAFTIACGQYDSAHHAVSKTRLHDVHLLQAQLGERLKMNEHQLIEVRRKLVQIGEYHAELNRLEEAAGQLKVETDAFVFTRSKIKDAGRMVRDRLVKGIGDQADSIFRQIMDDYTQALVWGPDYGLSVEYRGEQRPFRALSGGEQMVAALALRLALLMQMTDIRFIFLDEPTANLDDKRRLNLAAKLSEIKMLHQIFVISHDDTFQGSSEHVLLVTKVQGVSDVKVLFDAPVH